MIVSMRLNLPKAYNKLTVRYNTFEKVSYDRYLIASLISNTKNKNKAYQIINDITGKGSLNEHLGKLYEEMSAFSTDEIESILRDSLFPIQKIEEFHYTYIKMLDLSIFGKKMIKGNLSDDLLFPVQLIKEEGTYVNHQYQESDPQVKMDTYYVSLSKESVSVKFGDDYYDISAEDFIKIIVKDEIDIRQYNGIVHTEIQGNEWMQLTKSSFNNMMSIKDFYYDNGNQVGIYNDYAKKSIVAYSWGIYWVKEENYRYQDPASSMVCVKVIDVLMEKGSINEYKTKSIVDLLKNIKRDKQQEVINYILKRKDSKELAGIAYVLIDKGYEKGWNDEAFAAMYKFKDSVNQLKMLYRINPAFPYTLNDLLDIERSDKKILKDNHRTLVSEYYNDCEAIKRSMRDKVGEVSLSGIRENIGKMQLDDETKKFRNMIKDIMAHFDKDIDKKTLEQLKELENKVNEFYRLFIITKKKWEEQDKLNTRR